MLLRGFCLFMYIRRARLMHGIIIYPARQAGTSIIGMAYQREDPISLVCSVTQNTYM